MDRRPRATWFLVVLVAAAIPWSAGCASGRVGGLYVLDGAVVVEDANPDRQHTALLKDGRATHLRGTLVPTTGGGWLVTDEAVPVLRSVRTSKLRADQRLPVWAKDHRLHLLELDSSRTRTLPNPLDSDDEQIRALRLAGDRLLASVGPRFNVQSEPGELRYVVYRLPNGPWEALPRNEGSRFFAQHARAPKFADLRRGAAREAGAGPGAAPSVKAWGSIASFQELQNRGLARGDWGELIEREVWGRHETVFRARDGKETVLLR